MTVPSRASEPAGLDDANAAQPDAEGESTPTLHEDPSMNRRLPAPAGGLFAVRLLARIVARGTARPADRLAWLDSHRAQYTRARLGEKSDEIAAHYSEQGRLMPRYHA